MKQHEPDASASRTVLIGMITQRQVLGRIAARWEPQGLFASRWENRLATMCVDAWRTYRDVPGRNIEMMFREAQAGRDDAETDALERFLAGLSHEYERNGEALTPEYVLDVAGRLFNRVRAKAKLEEARDELDRGNDDAFNSLVETHRRINLGRREILRPADMTDVWEGVLEQEMMQPLIQWPGDLGDFINPEFVREAFVAIVGITGDGKSFWLMDAAVRAVRQKRRVAFFEVGDMSQRQFLLRLGQRVTRSPRRPETYRWPVDWEEYGEDEENRRVRPVFDDRRGEPPLVGRVEGEFRRIQQGKDRLRISCHSSGAIGVDGIVAELEEHAQDGWVPDVVVIDYADLLAAPAGARDDREAINGNWLAMRRLSQDWHCLVLTATQADANAYDRGTLRLGNFANDRRKNDHVTAMMSLNRVDFERAQGVTRIGWLKRRDEAPAAGRQCRVAGCLAVGCPAVISRFGV